MATKKRNSPSGNGAQKEDLRRCKQHLRFLLGQLGDSLPGQQSAFESVFLMHFQHAVNHPASLKATKGPSRHG